MSEATRIELQRGLAPTPAAAPPARAARALQRHARQWRANRAFSPRRERGTIAVSPAALSPTDSGFLMTTTPFPLEPTAADAQAAIAEEFSFFGDWSERYQYLIDLGRKLPAFPEHWKTEEHRLHGCQSMVWIVPEGNAERLDFHAVSDSAIVSGLIYLALRVYSGRSAQEILATEPDYIAGIGLAKHLSPTRSNGVAAMLAFIRDTARAQQ
jgi:cysteine desulfuration protein SufE